MNKKTIQDWLDHFGVGTMVNVKAHPTDDCFASFTGRVKGISRTNHILVKNEETDEEWETCPEQLSFNSDEYMHDREDEHLMVLSEQQNETPKD